MTGMEAGATVRVAPADRPFESGITIVDLETGCGVWLTPEFVEEYRKAGD